MGTEIEIVNAKEHNLQNITTKIPRDSLVVVTGVSGSGKSSLAFDTLFQEGQRKYIESLSSYARQFIGQMKAPEVEHISGISPTISIDQKTVNRNPRSTVGTVTGVYDFFRLLFARLGTPHCPDCGDVIKSQTVDQIASQLEYNYPGEKLMVMAPIVIDRKGEYRKELDSLRSSGFLRARIDGEIRLLEDNIQLKRYEKHTIEAIIDRLQVEPKYMPRIREGIEKAVELADGMVSFLIVRDEGEKGELKLKKKSGEKGNKHLVQSTELACAKCGISLPEIEPRFFSFNSVQGACPECEGLGYKQDFDPDLVIPDPDLSISEGAIKSMTDNGNIVFSHYGIQEIEILAKKYGFSLNKPWKSLSKKAQNIVLWGSDESLQFKLVRDRKYRKSVTSENRPIRGVIEVMQRVYDRWRIPMMEKYMRRSVCKSCEGKRLSRESLAVTFRDKNIVEYNNMSISQAHSLFSQLKLSEYEHKVGREIFKEIKNRLGFLNDVGLGYLSMNRSAVTLSGGEGQRIRLASQVGAGLQGVMYVLDEPSIGLHPRDNKQLLKTLFHLRDLGNSLIVVEHDEETMRSADHVLDIGPGAGVEGGKIVGEGSFSQIKKNKDSLTAGYLNGRLKIEIPSKRRKPGKQWLQLKGASENNLKNIQVKFPLGVFVGVTGVSGSGKSTLINAILKKVIARELYGNGEEPGKFKSLEGLEHIDRMVEIDQTPIGRTPRSNPVTYTKVFDHIRDLFAGLPESKIRGYKKGRFSFNVAGGRCEHCGGAGVREIEMQLLANVSVPCEECNGKRFNDATLEVHYKGLNIYDVLELSISEACKFFSAQPKIMRGLDMMDKIGLGYIKLGQPSTTLSGGEAQRVKLSSELQKPGTGKTLYLLDEPTTGLHFADIAKLLESLQSLVDKGNTVIVIEHNLDVIKTVDYILDLGPEGGDEGGQIVAKGTPEEVAKISKSHTGKALKAVLDNKPQGRPSKIKGIGQQHRNIVVKGGYKHNLKNIDVEIPKNKLTVVTGVSGSGKSSLAFSTLFAEGQRRFIESLSTYARRFVGQLDKGDVESIEGLAPAIAIDQKSAGRSSKSTVATITEIYDYFRLLYARLGEIHCPHCSKKLDFYSLQTIVKSCFEKYASENLRILAPLYLKNVDHDFYLDTPGHLTGAASQLGEQGFRRYYLDGKFVEQEELPKNIKANSISLYIDSLNLKESNRGRFTEGIEAALDKGHGICVLQTSDGKEEFFGVKPFCSEGHYFMRDAIEPRNFSFNSHWGACAKCQGLGNVQQISPRALISNASAPLLSGGITSPLNRKFKRRTGYYHTLLKNQLADWGYDAKASFSDLSKQHQKDFIYGSLETLNIKRRTRRASHEYSAQWKGLLFLAEKWFASHHTLTWLVGRARLVEDALCPECHGSRLMKPFSEVSFHQKTIGEISNMTVASCVHFFNNLKLSAYEKLIGEQILREITGRLNFLDSVGLGYLGLHRTGSSLSGGEAQRIRLASQIGSGLEGVLYVLDEPTVGLHQRDTAQLVHTLKKLRDLGNTVVVVEHDPEMIQSADWIVDMGPEAGEFGGEVIATGTPKQIKKMPLSKTGKYLSKFIEVGKPPENIKEATKFIEIEAAQIHNLKSISTKIPLNMLTVFCGVSGSGKSSLVMDVLAKNVEKALAKKTSQPENCGKFKMPSEIKNLILVDQSPLGSNPRSNPITYGKAFDKIREIFAKVPEAKVKGFTRTRFSINMGVGRCSSCEGMGKIKLEMHFLSDVWVTCDSCKGKRYNEDTLEIKFKGKSISDILEMRVSEAVGFFSFQNSIAKYLKTLEDVGLGYLKLGQSANTLSGGEAQRIKLAAELAKSSRGHNLYILDEPTTGLHMADISMLLSVMQRLVEQGHTMVVIEHQMDVIKNAHWLVELGPDGGEKGGNIIYEGRASSLAEQSTPTAKALVAPKLQKI